MTEEDEIVHTWRALDAAPIRASQMKRRMLRTRLVMPLFLPTCPIPAARMKSPMRDFRAATYGFGKDRYSAR
ncbi:hypothetical protein ACUSIJ_27390 [Pseudochelatococcus sp. B33]